MIADQEAGILFHQRRR